MRFPPVLYRHAATALLLGTALCASHAQGKYPDKPVRVVVPFPAGSASDNIGRQVLQEVGPLLGGTFFVDNRAGAAGFIGMDLASKAAADGYTLVVSSSSTHSINPWVFKKLPYDPIGGSTNISCLATLPQVIVVAADSPFKNLRQLVDFGKANPGKLSYAWGTSSAQVASAAFTRIGGFHAEPIPYKGAADGLLSLLRGDTQFMVVDLTSSMAQIRGGKLKALAIASDSGSARLPGVPSFRDAGIPGYDMVTWVGLSAPAGVPRGISESIAKAVEVAMHKDSIKQRYADWGIEACAAGQAAFEKFVLEQQGIWKTKIQEVGIAPQ